MWPLLILSTHPSLCKSFAVAFTFTNASLKNKVCVESFAVAFTCTNIIGVNGYVTKFWLKTNVDSPKT